MTAIGGVGFGCGTIEITAQSGPSGENPSGQVTCESFFAGPVTCLNVHGNVALLTAQTPQFGSLAFRVIDNGPAGADVVEAVVASGCATPQISYVTFNFRGDAMVVDAPPLPTSKEQCKKADTPRSASATRGSASRSSTRGTTHRSDARDPWPARRRAGRRSACLT